MDRFTISLDENLATAFDDLIKERGYATKAASLAAERREPNGPSLVR